MTDTCRTVIVDGTPVVVRGPGPVTNDDRAALSDLVAAGRRMYEGMTPEQKTELDARRTAGRERIRRIRAGL